MKTNFKKIVLVAVLLVVLASVIAVALFVADRLDNHGEEIPSDGSDFENTMNAVYIDGEKYYPRLGVRNYLIMGIDKFEGQDKRGQSDFIMILSIDLYSEKYTIVSVNRDTMVEVDHYDTNEKKGETKVEQIALSHAYGKKDVESNKQKCKNTELSVSRLFGGMKFDGYISMTMDAVEVIVDSIGGVEVLVTDDLTAYDPRLVKDTYVMLDGELALKFVRARGGLEDSTNIARMARQEEFLRAFFEKLGVESSVSEALDFYEEVTPKLVSNMDEIEQLNLVTKIAEFERQDSITPEGAGIINPETKLREFYVSDASIKEILKDIFYDKAN